MSRVSQVILIAFVACSATPSLQPDTVISTPGIEHQTLIAHPLPITNDCPSGMVRINSFCIDQYEYPNIKGSYPYFAMSAYDAEKVCSDINKRLCDRDEWNIACSGPDRKPYPYGMNYQHGVCNDDKMGWVPVPWMTMGTPAWNIWSKQQYKGEQSGNKIGCVSDYGVVDMTGNIAEWVKDIKSPHGYVTKGGYWYGVLGHGNTPSCGFANVAHSPGFNSYEMGTRCCKWPE
jgi:sulfatase modifying factor 1